MSTDKFFIGANTQSDAVDASMQPKLSYRFKVSFIGMGGSTTSTNSTTLTAYVTTVTPPNFQQEEVPIDTYVSRYYVIGKHTIGTLAIELRNDASNVVASEVQKQIDRQYNASSQSHAPNAGAVKFITKIFYLDGANNADGRGNAPEALEGFVCTGCWLSDVQWGALNYTSSEPVTISLTIRPDNFYHIVGTAAIGTTAGLSEEDIHAGKSSAMDITSADVATGVTSAI